MGSYWFGRPHMTVNAFLIDGLLVDTGNPNMKIEFLRELVNESIEQCVITHHHEDHSGNAAAIVNRLNVKTYASPLCVQILKSPSFVSPIQYVTWGQNKKVNCTALDMTTSLSTNKYSFEIIETPGHAKDMICLYEQDEGWLFSADNFVNRFINVFMDDEDIGAQILSLKKILALDFDVLLCSHFPQFRNGKSHIHSKLQFLQDFYGEVSIEYKKGKSAKDIMSALGLVEKNNVHILSFGKLSQLNMIKSVIRDLS